jgi:hypothetical protein
MLDVIDGDGVPDTLFHGDARFFMLQEIWWLVVDRTEPATETPGGRKKDRLLSACFSKEDHRDPPRSTDI